MKDNAIYLEADEDITSAIDKLGKASGDAVQIVVPKRSGLLQSIINLKLLKKAAEQSGKELVLVTNDRIATDLASRVGLAIAPSLGAKAVINEAAMPEQLKSHEEVIEADDPEPPAPEPVVAAKPKPARRPFLKSREVGDGPPTPAAPLSEPGTEAAAESGTKAVAATKPTGLKVPNFKRLQHRLMWAGLATVLIFGYMLTMFLITSAKVTLYANGTKVEIDTTFSVDPSLKTTDKAKAVLAGQTVSVSKDLSGTFAPTGKKDVGTKASGQITVYNCNDAADHVLQAGTRFAAPDGKIFRSNSDVTVGGATIGSSSLCSNGGGFIKPGSVAVSVTADQNGDSYNEGPGKYTIVAYPADLQKTIYGQGAQMSGGTSKTVSVVSASDVDTAKAALTEKDKDNATRDLSGRVPSGYVPLTASQSSSVESTTSSPTIDAEGSTGTLVLKITYSVLAVKESEYQELVRAQELKQIGDSNQIYDDGLKDAQVTVTDKDSSGRRSFHLTTEAYGGAKLDIPAITEKLKGQRYGDAAAVASRLPGVNRAEVSITPGWATSLPKRTDKIHITIQVAGQK